MTLITVKITGETGLDKIKEIVLAPFTGVRGALVRRRAVAVFRDQFARGGYFSSTGFRAWTPTQPFGSKPATVPTLGGGGSSLLDAMAGGPGGQWTTTKDRVRLSLSLIYAAVHHEGAAIGVTAKMRGFVRHAFGVHLRPDKRSIIIPRRPLFDTGSQELIEAGRGVVVEAILEAAA